MTNCHVGVPLALPTSMRFWNLRDKLTRRFQSATASRHATQGGAGCSLGLRLPFSPKFLGALLRHPGITLKLCSQLCSNKHLLPTCPIFDHSPHICQNEYNKYSNSFTVLSGAS